MDDVINKTITIDEIKESFAKLRDETGYSPLEDIDSCMLKNSDDSIYDLQHLSMICTTLGLIKENFQMKLR